MNLRIAYVVLALAFVLGSSISAFSPTLAQSYTTVNVLQAFDMVSSKPSLVVLDVRNQSEYDTGHIRNAKLIPLFELSGRLNELNKSDEILVYCKSGARSAQASELLVNNSFPYVFNMIGGIIAWTNAAYPIYIKYASIQQAINNATAGSTLRISKGVYHENIVANKSIALAGENKIDTLVDGRINGTPGTAFYIKANNVSISQFTLRTYGCFTSECGYISGVRVENYRKGINITENVVDNNGFGMKLDSAQNVLIANNSITNSYDWSITTSNSSDISVLDNNITGNTYGLHFANSTNITISRNAISNDWTGISLLNSNNSVIVGNTISLNKPGYGIQIQKSNNGTFFHNNFIDNLLNVGTTNSTNNWTNGEEGNFWSDYNGTDANNDGIGDTPYFSRGTHIDTQPLMGPFNAYSAGIWNATKQTIEIISNSTISSFNLNAALGMLSFNATGMNGTGFSRIKLPTVIAKEMLQNNYVIRIDNQTVSFKNWTTTESEYVFFSYLHSEHKIQVVAAALIPEYPPVTALLLLFAASLLTLVFRTKKKRSIQACSSPAV